MIGLKRTFLPLIIFYITFMAPSLADDTGSFKAILNLSPKVSSKNPLLRVSVTTDPLVKGWIEDEKEAKRAVAKIKGYKKRLKTSKGGDRITIIKKIYILTTRLANYYKNPSNIKPLNKYPQKKSFQKYANDSMDYALKLAKATKNQTLKYNALYQHYTTKMILDTKSHNKSLHKLIEIKDSVAPKLKDNIEILVAMSFTDSPLTQKEAIQTLKEKLNGAGFNTAINIHLFLAKSYAGVDSDFDRTNKIIDPRYKKHLKKAIDKGYHLPPELNKQLIDFAVLLWDKTYKGPDKWSNFHLPKNTNGFNTIIALKERRLLESLNKHNLVQVINGYQKLKVYLNNHRQKSSFDKRIIDLEFENYKHTNNHLRYEKALVGLKSKDSSTVEYYKKRYIDFVQNFINSSLKPKQSTSKKRQAIDLGLRISKNLKKSDNKLLAIRENIPVLYYRIKDHSKSAQYYLYLAKLYKKHQQDFLKRALIPQSILAKWPLKIDWRLAKKTKSHIAERQKLLGVYRRLVVSNAKNTPIHYIVQKAILQINLGNNKDGYLDLVKAIKANTTSILAANAAGYLFFHHYTNKNWEEFLKIASIAKKQRLTSAYYQNQPYHWRGKMGEVLFNSGAQFFRKFQYKKSIERLKELVTNYRKHDKREEGLFLLAHAYNTNKTKFNDLDTLKTLVTEYPKTNHLEKALLNGGKWALQQNQSPYIYFFYERYLKLFNKNDDVPTIRRIVAHEYFSNKHYAEALQKFKEQVKDPKVPRAEKIRSALAYMHIEERFGEYKHGMWASDMVLKLAYNIDLYRSKALSFKARYAVKKRDLKWLIQLEHQMAKIKSNNPQINDHLGFVRFAIAELKVKPIVNPEQIISLKDPKRSIQTYYNQFQSNRVEYERVCAKVNKFCAPAKFRIAKHSIDTQKAIEIIKIPSNLSKKTIINFDLYKEQYLTKLKNTQLQSNAVATQLAKEGKTTKRWRQDILSKKAPILAH